MANNNKNKKPAVEAPVVDKKPTAEEANVQTPATVQMPNIGIPSGLSQDAKVAYMRGIQHRKDEMLKNGGESANHYVALTMLEDLTILDIAVTEAVVHKNPMGCILAKDEQNWNTLKMLAEERGVKLPDYKNLTKPTKEQLAAAGLEAAPNQVVLAIEEKHISAETKKKVQREAKLNEEAQSGKKEYLKDHTKIETDEQLKEALEFQLVTGSSTNPITRLVTTTQFYRAYLEARAEKADDPKAELAKIHELTLADLLQDITTMVKPTFVLEGFGKRLGTLAQDANSVVPAFCNFKNCVLNKKTGKYEYDDETIASLTRVVIAWYASAKSAELSASIEAKNKNLAVLKKDAKANAKAIESEEKKISVDKKNIEMYTNMLALVNEPSFDLANGFIAAYNNNEDPNHMYAVKVYKDVVYTYGYDQMEITELEHDSLLLNVQQHIGIILNMFNSEAGKQEEYNESNLVAFESKSVEEKPAEGEGKNA
jgi:hypothetical protein